MHALILASSLVNEPGTVDILDRLVSLETIVCIEHWRQSVHLAWRKLAVWIEVIENAGCIFVTEPPLEIFDLLE